PQTFVTPEIRMDCPDELKFRVVEEVKNRLARNHQVIDIDGVRVPFADGWGLIRPSNTQPVLVLRFEATTEKRRDEIRSYIEAVLEDTLKDLRI
ncbi:MAG: phosphomannomutase, partial [Syntrophales bacterium]|nr:phosphomannomutase [Syntrophales bacterium]